MNTGKALLAARTLVTGLVVGTAAIGYAASVGTTASAAGGHSDHSSVVQAKKEYKQSSTDDVVMAKKEYKQSSTDDVVMAKKEYRMTVTPTDLEN